MGYIAVTVLLWDDPQICLGNTKKLDLHSMFYGSLSKNEWLHNTKKGSIYLINGRNNYFIFVTLCYNWAQQNIFLVYTTQHLNYIFTNSLSDLWVLEICPLLKTKSTESTYIFCSLIFTITTITFSLDL